MTQNLKTRAEANAQKAFVRYVDIRRAYGKGHATIAQVARSLAVLDLTLIANRKRP